MATAVNSIISRPIFNAQAKLEADQRKTAQSFTQIFTTILAKQMRQSMVGEDKGPFGTAGGTTGDIYGAFFDEAMGKALAASTSMKPLNRMIERGLAGPRHPVNDATEAAAGAAGAAETALRAAESEKMNLQYGARADTSVAETVAPMPRIETAPSLPRGSDGPLLLPPAPTSMAPILPPPSSLEG